MLALLENQTTDEQFEEIISAEAWPRTIISLAEEFEDQLVRAKAARFIGSVAVDGAKNERGKEPYSLNQAAVEAAGGNEIAEKMIRTNFWSDVIERTIKSGHIMKAELETDQAGQILQHGQSALDTQANSLKFAASSWQMRGRTEAETRNAFRLQGAYDRGLLDDYIFLVVSRAADNMSDKAKTEAGFFTDTMSAAIQATTIKNGKLTIESAFVAGKETWNSPRHDYKTAREFGRRLGVDFSGSATKTIDTPILVHKSLMPNGVIDAVKLWDESADGGVFFGEAKPMQDYLAYREVCREREKGLGPIVDKITSQLIAEAGQLSSPSHASRRLAELSQQEMLEQSIVDARIDPRVFGVQAAYRIEHARSYLAAGDYENVLRLTGQAQRVATSSSCPGGLLGSGSADNFNNESEYKFDDKKPELDDCEFTSKECPKCHKKNVKTIVKKGKYYGDCGCHS